MTKSAKLDLLYDEEVDDLESLRNKRAMLPSLPPEVWMEIFEQVDDVESLKASRKVCKSWNCVVVPVLIKRIHVSITVRSISWRSMNRIELSLARIRGNKTQLELFIETIRAAEARPDIPHPCKFVALTFRGMCNLYDEVHGLLRELKTFSTLSVYYMGFFDLPYFEFGSIVLRKNKEARQLGLLNRLDFKELQIFELDKFFIKSKRALKRLMAFLRLLTSIEELKCGLVFKNDCVFFSASTWDSTIIRGFLQIKNLKSLDVSFRPLYKVFDTVDEDGFIYHEGIRANERFTSVGKSLKKAFRSRQVVVTWRHRTKFVTSAIFDSPDDLERYSSDEEENVESVKQEVTYRSVIVVFIVCLVIFFSALYALILTMSLSPSFSSY